MGRLCERPGCSADAAMAYGFDADRLLVWLAPHDPADERWGSGVLCTRHAEAMIVPRGWTLDDRRDDRPRLFRAPAVTASRRARSKRRPAPGPAATQLALPAPEEPTVADVTGGTVTGAVDEPTDETVALPWRPAFDQLDDLGGVLDAESPLLARAFRGTDRRR